MYDVVIAGGGPAGLSAALTLGRVHRMVLLVDSGEGRNAPASAMHNFLTRDGTPPAEVRRIAHEQLAAYPTVEIVNGSVSQVHPLEGGAFRVTLAGGRAETTRRILLATGVADELPPIEGLFPLWGRSAFHCPYCHGYEVSGKPIGVVGADPPQLRLALHLTQFNRDVALCTNGAPIPDGPWFNRLRSIGVAVRLEPIVRFDGRDGKLERIVFEGGEPLEREAVFINTRLRQRSDLALQLGCAVFEDGIVDVNDFGQASVRGVYAAGDMARRATLPMPLAAVITAAASGTVAACMIDQDLLNADFNLSNPVPHTRW